MPMVSQLQSIIVFRPRFDWPAFAAAFHWSDLGDTDKQKENTCHEGYNTCHRKENTCQHGVRDENSRNGEEGLKMARSQKGGWKKRRTNANE